MIPGTIVRQIHWSCLYTVGNRVASRFKLHRCFLAGDSAHSHSPFFSEGLNLGIQVRSCLSFSFSFSLFLFFSDQTGVKVSCRPLLLLFLLPLLLSQSLCYLRSTAVSLDRVKDRARVQTFPEMNNGSSFILRVCLVYPYLSLYI